MKNQQRHCYGSSGGIQDPGQTKESLRLRRKVGAAVEAVADAAVGLAAGGSAVVQVRGL